jgi:hypothetical protein
MTKLKKTFGIVLLATMAGQTSVQSVWAQIAPLDLSGIQNQAQGVIQQQSVGSQLNSLRLQQNITQDRIRELDLFRPQQPFGATTYYQPQPSGLPPLPQQDALSQQANAPLPVPPTAPLALPPTAKQTRN